MPFTAVADPSSAGAPRFASWAARPPMGWNSWDCFGCTVTEALTKTNADFMAEHLKSHGWEYVVVDIQWYDSQSTNWHYAPLSGAVLDPYGRLLPAPSKFPSSTNGQGFKPLADSIHRRGLKFGVHLMRGIPREAVRRNCPILGTAAHATQIADTNSICDWNPDMYGVDMTRPGAQEYYNSVFDLLASWGVDFVKVDDSARPYHEPEISAIRKAIDRCGRPMVLSLSPGPTPLVQASHVLQHANMWRLVDDLWDNWQTVVPIFELCNVWTPYRQPGTWPDIDMLPLGAINVGLEMKHESTQFTRDEQLTLMTLWCITRAPLIFGGHLPWSDAFTLSLLTNDDVIAVDQFSQGNRQLFHTNDTIAWIANVPDSPDRYLALFHAPDQDVTLDPAKALFGSDVLTAAQDRNRCPIRASIKGVKRLYLHVDNAGDGSDWDDANWIEPELTGPGGAPRLKLTDLKWKLATAGWGRARVNRNVDDQPLTSHGHPAGWGIGTHADSIIEYELPEGYETFNAVGAVDEGTGGRGTVRFELYDENGARHHATNATVTVTLSDLGFR
ncbi:MAG TPA: NPCBM/NEW2 domain-containing protein, partial [Verrucomicrobiae bacterium]|nr:NPCBM/NEW2 domain-containing protein [Verrucomicrobiae bacterium]